MVKSLNFDRFLHGPCKLPPNEAEKSLSIIACVNRSSISYLSIEKAFHISNILTNSHKEKMLRRLSSSLSP